MIILNNKKIFIKIDKVLKASTSICKYLFYSEFNKLPRKIINFNKKYNYRISSLTQR